MDENAEADTVNRLYFTQGQLSGGFIRAMI